jgi:putative transcriptional regulator
MKKTVKTKIKEYRARHDMRQDELAALVGVRRETIYHLEKGRYNPSLILADSIAHVFGVTIEDIFEIIDEE